MDASAMPLKRKNHGTTDMIAGVVLGVAVIAIVIPALFYFQSRTPGGKKGSVVTNYPPSMDSRVVQVNGALKLPMQTADELESCHIHRAGNPLLHSLSYTEDPSVLVGEFKGTIDQLTTDFSSTQFRFLLSSQVGNQSHLFTVSKDIPLYDANTHQFLTPDSLSHYTIATITFNCSLVGKENFHYIRLALQK